jgi:hypothetical protein
MVVIFLFNLYAIFSLSFNIATTNDLSSTCRNSIFPTNVSFNLKEDQLIENQILSYKFPYFFKGASTFAPVTTMKSSSLKLNSIFSASISPINSRAVLTMLYFFTTFE